ncbi:DMT family protein [Asticcacaulis sp. YBE204]|uniref:DMT family protein n=1 Tax=Asticcacaulis sp. YBE204 TaxID=1282363 RepID=UPI0003C3D7D8|nr:DMT family protein [Asticcacaulis sp. YBE204]ESQ80196.1 membrane protein [Asticcacaulis sp. YBE204]
MPSFSTLHPALATVLLLIASNVFMTFAWYGHLKDKSQKLWVAIALSWGIAFFEYCLMVPANRIGYGTFNAAQLKTIQEVITLSVFVVFSVFYLGEAIRWTHVVGFVLIAAGAGFIFYKG